MNHTPGPWEYDTELADAGNKSTPMYSEAENVDADIFEPVCIIPHDDITEASYKQVKANARLIAAAPELKDLLIEAHDYLGAHLADHEDYGDRAIMNRIDALLKRIEGE